MPARILGGRRGLGSVRCRGGLLLRLTLQFNVRTSARITPTPCREGLLLRQNLHEHVESSARITPPCAGTGVPSSARITPPYAGTGVPPPESGCQMKPGFRARLNQTGTKPSFIWIPLPDTNYAPYRADPSLPRVVRMRFGVDMGLGCATRAARSARHRPPAA